MAIELEKQVARGEVFGAGEAMTQWFLDLNHDEPQGTALRPHLPFGPNAELLGLRASSDTLMAAVPLSLLLEPLPLDALTVASDTTFLARVAQQKNLPDYIKIFQLSIKPKGSVANIFMRKLRLSSYVFAGMTYSDSVSNIKCRSKYNRQGRKFLCQQF